jgi:hemerythrin-like metal-binding protein
MLTWTPSLEAGVPWIDARHRELFDRAAKLEAASTAGDPGDRLEELLAFLAEDASEHFAAEEEDLRDVGCRRPSGHVQEHRAFLPGFRSLVPQWNSEGGSKRTAPSPGRPASHYPRMTTMVSLALPSTQRALPFPSNPR